MKKHEMVLDFTSLLDVILIILFLVLCSMNGKAQKDAKKIDDLEASAAALTSENGQMKGQIDDLEKQNKELAELLEEARKASLEKGQEVDRLTAENQKLEELLETAKQLAKSYENLNGLTPADAKCLELLKNNTIDINIKITKTSADDGRHHYITLVAQNVRANGYLIEDAERNDSGNDMYRFQNDFSEWLQKELDNLQSIYDFQIGLVNIEYDNNAILADAFEVVKNATKALNEENYLILIYENGKKI